jgi:hypothetical protein
MEEVYLDLSDKIFIHKDFVEVVGLKYTNKKALLEHLEEYINVGRLIKVNVWNGDKLEEVLVEPIVLSSLVTIKRIVRFS